jgi:hypothetical protein
MTLHHAIEFAIAAVVASGWVYAIERRRHLAAKLAMAAVFAAAIGIAVPTPQSWLSNELWGVLLYAAVMTTTWLVGRTRGWGYAIANFVVAPGTAFVVMMAGDGFTFPAFVVMPVAVGSVFVVGSRLWRLSSGKAAETAVPAKEAEPEPAPRRKSA